MTKETVTVQTNRSHTHDGLKFLVITAVFIALT